MENRRLARIVISSCHDPSLGPDRDGHPEQGRSKRPLACNHKNISCEIILEDKQNIEIPLYKLNKFWIWPIKKSNMFYTSPWTFYRNKNDNMSKPGKGLGWTNKTMKLKENQQTGKMAFCRKEGLPILDVLIETTL